MGEKSTLNQAKADDFYDALKKNNLGPIIGVPCSIFKPFLNYLINEEKEVIFPPNEGPAMGIAAGTFAATGKIPVVFMQNSGLNNTANSLTSFHLLYKIPALLLISWRGEKPEAPEHNITGANLKKFLSVLELPYIILNKNWQNQLRKITQTIRERQAPVAAVVRQGFFAEYPIPSKNEQTKFPLSRLEAITLIKKLLPGALFISSTGYPSRDSYSVRSNTDFYMLGSMGHTLAFAIGIAKEAKDKLVVCFDGDGSALMHLGTLSLIKTRAPRNLLYVVLNNQIYESTGGQPLDNKEIDFLKIGQGMKIPRSIKVVTPASIKKAITVFKKNRLSTLLWIKLNQKEEKVGGRVEDDPPEILRKFRQELR